MHVEFLNLISGQIALSTVERTLCTSISCRALLKAASCRICFMIADLASEVEEKGSEELEIASMVCGCSWIIECPDSINE